MNRWPNVPETHQRSPRSPRVLISAGPTHEPIDTVRYLANRSSGRMGLALAQASAKRDWPTTLLLGPAAVNSTEFSHLHTVRFHTTADLQRLLRELWPSHDLLFMAAAVADYRPVRPFQGTAQEPVDKIKRAKTRLVLELEPTPDLLAEAAKQSRPDQILIGFALEPEARLAESAQHKLAAKGLHAIVANPLETMDSPMISARVFLRDGGILDPGGQLSKQEFADWLLEQMPAICAPARV